MSFDMNSIPLSFRSDLAKATEVLQSFGAREVYVFGSLIGSRAEGEPSDLDLAVAGLPPERFFRTYGELLGVLEHRFDLVDLDVDSRFVQKLRTGGRLARVA